MRWTSPTSSHRPKMKKPKKSQGIKMEDNKTRPDKTKETPGHQNGRKQTKVDTLSLIAWNHGIVNVLAHCNVLKVFWSKCILRIWPRRCLFPSEVWADTQLLLQEIECQSAATCHQNNCRHTHNYVLSAPVPLKLTCTYKLNYLLLKRTDLNYPVSCWYNNQLKSSLVVGRTDPKKENKKAPKWTQNFAMGSPYFFTFQCDRPR